MKNAGSMVLRDLPVAPEAFSLPARRASLFKRVLIALHLSRRRQARMIIRSHRHLLARDASILPASPSLDVTHESTQNAHADQTAVHANASADRS